jgi:hypothetical protein
LVTSNVTTVVGVCPEAIGQANSHEMARAISSLYAWGLPPGAKPDGWKKLRRFFIFIFLV